MNIKDRKRAIEVGRCGEGWNDVWIGVPKDRCEPIKSVATGKIEKHAIRLTLADVEWLVAALKKELRQ